MAGWILLGIAALLCLLLLAPIRVRAKYDKELFVTVSYLFFRYRVAPVKQKPKKPRRDAKPKTPQKQRFEDEKNLFSLLDKAKELAPPVASMINHVLSKGRITRLALYMDVAGDNPAEAAVSAGRLNAAAYGIYGLIHDLFRRVCLPDILILPDYYAEKTDVFFEGRLHVSLGAAIASAVRFLVHLLRAKASPAPAKQRQPAGI